MLHSSVVVGVIVISKVQANKPMNFWCKGSSRSTCKMLATQKCFFRSLKYIIIADVHHHLPDKYYFACFSCTDTRRTSPLFSSAPFYLSATQVHKSTVKSRLLQVHLALSHSSSAKATPVSLLSSTWISPLVKEKASDIQKSFTRLMIIYTILSTLYATDSTCENAKIELVLKHTFVGAKIPVGM